MPSSLDSVARSTDPDPDLVRVQRFARWLDVVPLDPILGLVLPGAGDVLGSFLGLYIVSIAVRRGLPAVVIARMLLNLAADSLIGAVPLLGDLGDLAFRANRKNAALLEARHDGRASTARDWAVVVGAGLALVGAVALTIWLAITVVRAIF